MVNVRETQTKEELRHADALVNQIFFEDFNFDYKKVASIAPKFNRQTFIAFSEDAMDILGTITLSDNTTTLQYPSEFYFGFKVPEKYQKDRILEMGKLVTRKEPAFSKYEKYTYLALLLMVKEYSKTHGIDRWIASVHTPLLKNIQGLGIPVEILDTKVKNKGEMIEAMGRYTFDVNFITASMKDSFIALEKFKHLVDSKTIEIILADLK